MNNASDPLPVSVDVDIGDKMLILMALRAGSTV